MFWGSLSARYTYIVVVIIWLLLSVHVGYLYVSFSADHESAKGGTFIEATLSPVNYIPYVTANDNDKFYQSFLFQGCLYPSISGTNILYREELCSVQTNDYRSFSISLRDEATWSDGTPVTLNDIYFTYETILKNNFRNIEHLESYKSISITPGESSLLVTFPTASIDNIIFFTNFILPAHQLANQSLDSYITTFLEKPIGSSCGRLSPSPNDPTSTVFDLSLCPDTLLKFYQVKHFTQERELETYLKNQTSTIDLIISDRKYPSYKHNDVILNKFFTIFFNTQNEKLNPGLRSSLAQWFLWVIYQGNYESVLYKDNFLFDSIQPGSGALSESTLIANLGEVVTPGSSTGEQPSLPNLPASIDWSEAPEQEFFLEETIQDKLTVQFLFPEQYDRVSVSHNQGVEYYPESYNSTEQFTYYNLNPLYRNVAAGTNRYTIKAYDQGQHVDTFSLTVHYLTPPTGIEGTGPSSSQHQTIDILYYDEDASNQVIEILSQAIKQAGFDAYFTFTPVDDPNVFDGKLQSHDYDVVLRGITMGLKKDISNIFITDVARLNPSRYTNDQLAQAVNSFFLAAPAERPEIKKLIDETFIKDVPFTIVGKYLTSFNIRESLDFPYPFRLYVLGRRKDFIKDLQLFQHLTIDRDKVYSMDNLEAFLRTTDLKKIVDITSS